MGSPADDPAWQHYADTVIEFEDGPAVDLRQPVAPESAAALRSLGLGRTFAVITAHNPGGRRLSHGENERRHDALLGELRSLGVPYRLATGGSPDGSHREPGVAVPLPLASAREMARRHEQSAFFLFDGEAFAIHGALVDTPPVALPPREEAVPVRPMFSNACAECAGSILHTCRNC
jgi:hypothetical protein